MRATRTALGARSLSILTTLAALLLLALPESARAQVGSDRYSSIVVEAATGNVLSAVNADEPRYPASLTKLMTLYMTFEALRDRRIALTDPVPVSAHAASMSPSKLGLLPGSQLTVEEAILGLVTKSANDAAAALGELLGGDEDRFAQMMTLRARALGMEHTIFRNASGLPDFEQVTTARDLAVLARSLVGDFPSYYAYFSTPSFVFRGRVIVNHDRLLQTYPGADGMKTGWIEASGHNLVTSAVHSGVRLIGVVLGAGSSYERDIHMATLLDRGFDQLGVSPEGQATVQVTSRLPALIPSARAASLAVPMRMPRPSEAALSRRASARAQNWGVQVGAFASDRAARQAALAARHLTDGGEPRVQLTALHGRAAWRARVGGLTAAEAQGTCAAMARRGVACFVVGRQSGQLASR